VNYDKNVQGAKRDAVRKAYDDKVKAKADKESARRAEAKARREDKEKELLEGIVGDLENSEGHSYSSVYDDLSEDGPPAVDDPHLLKFLIEHTNVRVESGNGERLADALRDVLETGEQHLDYDSFLKFLRDNAVSDSTAVGKFLETSMGQDSLSKTEASAHALHIAQKMIRITFPKEKWDIILHAITNELEPLVSLKEFIQTSKKLSRCARLLQFLEVELPEDDEDNPIVGLSDLDAQRWQDLAEDIARRLPAGRVGSAATSRDEETDLHRASAKDAGGSLASSQATGNPKCDLCKASGGTCFYHAKKGSASSTCISTSHGSSSSASDSRGSSSSTQVASSSSTASGSAGSSSSSSMSSVSHAACEDPVRAELQAALLAGKISRLEDAIVAADDAGVHEDELLSPFARLEELWGSSEAISCR